MKHQRSFLNMILLFALLVVSLGFPTQPAAAAEGDYVCIPTCSTVDGRMLSLASVGYSTMAGETISLKIAAPGSVSTFNLGIFDGDTSGLWDRGTTPLVYTLYADPTGTGDTSVQLTQWLGSSMANNAWTDFEVAQAPEAMAPSGNYIYHMHVVLPDAATVQAWSNFKLRSTSPLELSTNETFAYAVPLYTMEEANVFYPSGFPSPNNPNVPTTFDGTWDMYLYVPVSSQSFVIWDGDMDHGSHDCTVNDTNDADTPDGVLPPFQISVSAVPEGIGAAANPCRDATGAVITGPNGQINATGAPADDVLNVLLRRSPSIIYEVTDPNGNMYSNTNPSGNLEWEQFRIDTNPNTPADYWVSELLPAGLFHIQVSGLDLTNLNAWYLATGEWICVYEDGTPCVPVLHPYLVGDTVWADNNGNGVQDADEMGIAGVLVSLVDENGVPIPGQTAITDAYGQFTFSVEAGTYSVQIDPSNFNVGGALAGFTSTTGGEAQTNTVVSDNVLTYDFGYMLSLGSIGDRVWNDLNRNGIQDNAEPGLAGIAVQLLGSDGVSVLATTTSAADGSYSFTNLPAGTYFLQFTLPDGYVFAIKNAQTSTPEDDSNVNRDTGITDAILLAAGVTDNSIDAGMKVPEQVINYCGYIRSPGFWKNYANHMSDETFQELIAHTQHFSYLTAKQAVTILKKNNGPTKMGIPELDGVSAPYLKFLLTAELNAVWNGQTDAAGLDGLFGFGIYHGTYTTVNNLLNQAYQDRRNFSAAERAMLEYLGAGGENDDTRTCLVQP